MSSTCECDTRYTGETVMKKHVYVDGKVAGQIRTCCFCMRNQLVVFGNPGTQEAYQSGEKSLNEIAPWAHEMKERRLFNLFPKDIKVLSLTEECTDAPQKNRDEQEKPEEEQVTIKAEARKADPVQRAYSEEPYRPSTRRGKKAKD